MKLLVKKIMLVNFHGENAQLNLTFRLACHKITNGFFATLNLEVFVHALKEERESILRHQTFLDDLGEFMT